MKTVIILSVMCFLAVQGKPAPCAPLAGVTADVEAALNLGGGGNGAAPCSGANPGVPNVPGGNGGPVPSVPGGVPSNPAGNLPNVGANPLPGGGVPASGCPSCGKAGSLIDADVFAAVGL